MKSDVEQQLRQFKHEKDEDIVHTLQRHKQ